MVNLLLAHNRKHLKFFLGLKRLSPDHYLVGTTFLTREDVDCCFAFSSFSSSKQRDENLVQYSSLSQRFSRECLSVSRLYSFERYFSFYPRLLGYAVDTSVYDESYICGFCYEVERFLIDSSVTLIISELIIGASDYLIHGVASNLSIKYIGIRESKIGSGVVFVDPMTEEVVPFLINDKASRGEAMDLIEAEIRSYRQPSYMKFSRKRGSYLSGGYLVRLLSELFDAIYFDQFDRVFIKVRYRVFRAVNLFRLRHILPKTLFSDCLPSQFYVFPLQFEPEATVMVRGYPYHDQIAVAEAIARGLPRDSTLVVKEHNGNEGYRSTIDYFRLAANPKIKLVAKDFSIEDILDRCSGVITISSRMGYEAMLRGKKVLCLGWPFWRGICPEVSREGVTLESLTARFAVSGNVAEFEDIVNLTSRYLVGRFDGTFLMLSERALSDSNLMSFDSAINKLRDYCVSK